MGSHSRNFLPFSKCGLGLISINDEPPRAINPNVIESSSVVLLNDIKPMMMTPTPTPTSPPPPPSSPQPPPPPLKKKDPGGIGFIDEMGGGVDGLMSCTESLGCESCDERRVDDDDINDDHDANDSDEHRCQHLVEFCEVERDRLRKKKSEKKRLLERNKKFPPPLSSLNQNGQPCFYLKSVRENGRLELTEVKIQRPEILRAVRENGRLRLHLVSSENEEEQEEELDFQEEEEEEKEVEEDFRRCQEHVMNHHHHINDHHSLLVHQDHHHHHHHHHMNEHHSLHGWRQPCVTTR